MYNNEALAPLTLCSRATRPPIRNSWHTGCAVNPLRQVRPSSSNQVSGWVSSKEMATIDLTLLESDFESCAGTMPSRVLVDWAPGLPLPPPTDADTDAVTMWKG